MNCQKRYHSFDDAVVKDACDKIDLLNYASGVIDFARQGPDSYAAKCPNHKDINASLFLTPSKNLWYCFGCAKGGGIINFIMEYEHLSYVDAVKKVLGLAGVSEVDARPKLRSSSLGFFKKVYGEQKVRPAAPARDCLPEDYMEQFVDETPEEWVEEGIDPEVMRLYGVRIDKRGNRIVYPVRDNDGNLIGVKGRTRYKDFKLLGIQKYMNYVKIGTCNYFQGMQQAADAIRESNEVIIVEGIKSVMKIRSFGMENVIAAETSRLNEAQIRLLIQKRIKNIVIAFDQDVDLEKIEENTLKLRRFANVSVVFDMDGLLEPKMSPCDAGKDVWLQLYNNRIDLRS